jgi:hypothetical protein
MRGIEVHVNGCRLCTAGITPDAALNATLDIVGHDGQYEMTLRVGGLEDDEFVIWSDREVRVDDEINIKIVETKLVDTPLRRARNAERESVG